MVFYGHSYVTLFYVVSREIYLCRVKEDIHYNIIKRYGNTIYATKMLELAFKQNILYPILF